MYKSFLCITSAILIFSNAVWADTQQKATIESAVIFLNGAELTSTARVTLQQGENEILFTNIAGNVNQQSLTISADRDVVVESSTFQNNYLVSDNLSPRATVLKDSIERLTIDRDLVNTQITVFNEQIAVLQSNKQVGGANTGMSVAELQKLLDLISTKMGNYINNKQTLTAKMKKMDEHITRLNQQLDEERKKDFQPGGQLKVKFYAKNATSTKITLTYVVPNAGWSPSYDLKVDKLNEPVHLYYKANVYQNCGVKWDNVHVTLSTGNPNENAQAPTLNPWYLAFYVPQPVYRYKKSANAGAPAYQNAEKSMEVMDAAPPQPTTMNEYVTVNNSGINTKFDIELPYTIPSDGQAHLVSIKTYDVPASYRYFAVPKMDENAFLQAQVTNWQDLDLLPGNSNIFYEGSYVGQGYIDVHNVTDTMSFSLGRDKKIVIKRERDKEKRSVKMIGSNVRESFSYNITIRNTRKEPLNMVILDQIPVSNDKDIVIEDKETTGGNINEATGEVKWEFNIKPNDTKKLTIGYTVKYPKGKQVTGL